MTNLRRLNLKKIYLFDESFENKISTNSLKEFLYYIRSSGVLGVIDFTYSGSSDSLHLELSIKENFILDSIPTSLIRDGENNLNIFLSGIKNPYLVELIEQIGDLSIKTKNLTLTQLKLVSIVKALLSPSEYVLVVRPEEFLSIETLNRIKKCMDFEANNNYKKIFLAAIEKETWLDISTHIISKCAETKMFSSHPNPLTHVKPQKPYSTELETFKKVG